MARFNEGDIVKVIGNRKRGEADSVYGVKHHLEIGDFGIIKYIKENEIADGVIVTNYIVWHGVFTQIINEGHLALVERAVQNGTD